MPRIPVRTDTFAKVATDKLRVALQSLPDAQRYGCIVGPFIGEIAPGKLPALRFTAPLVRKGRAVSSIRLRVELSDIERELNYASERLQGID